jgi:site-specific DNA recombinase
MGEMFIENLAAHTRRGLAGVIREGRHAGGRAYGYRATATPGQLAIDEREAAIVRRIFEAYVAGQAPRAIAANLNSDGIDAPRGKRWNASTINGNRTRGGGILLNTLYRGEITWNRVRMIKDPTTGKRISRPNPESDVMRTAAPHLRIVSDELFAAAQTRKQLEKPRAAHLHRRPKRLLSGLLRCGSCGAGMASIGMTGKNARVQCSAHRESGTCDNGRKIDRAAIERLVLNGLRQCFERPDYLSAYVAEYNAERSRLASEGTSRRAALERRQEANARARDRLLQALMYGDDNPTTFQEPLAKLERERSVIAAEIANLDDAPRPVQLHTSAIARFARDIGHLQDILDQDDSDTEEAIQLVRQIIDAVIVYAEPGQTGFSIEIKGLLGELIDDRDPFSREGGSLVARGRFAQSPLPTFSLRLSA